MEPWKSWPKLFALDLNCQSENGLASPSFNPSEETLLEDTIIQFWQEINRVINGRRDTYNLAFADDLFFFRNLFESDVAIQIETAGAETENYVGFRDFEFNYLRKLIASGKNVVDGAIRTGMEFETRGQEIVMPIKSSLTLTDGITGDAAYEQEWYFVKRGNDAKVKAVRLAAV